MKPINPDFLYVQSIGTLMDTKQFAKMQKLLEPLNEMERMEILWNQLKLEVEADVSKRQE